MSTKPVGGVKRLGNHVAALARTKDPLALAEELLCKQEHNLELQHQLKCLMTENRHLEVELSSSRQALRLMQQQQQFQQADTPLTGHPPVLSFHQQSCLLSTVQQQEEALQQAQEQELCDHAMLGHLSCVLQQVQAAVQAATETQGPQQGDRLAHDLLAMLEAFQHPVVAPSPSASPVSSLAVAQQAHKVLLQQALLLRSKLARPAASSSSTTRPGSAAPQAAASRPRSTRRQGSSMGAAGTASHKAQELLHFLHSHVQRMQELVTALSGSPQGQEAAQPSMQCASAGTGPKACTPTGSDALSSSRPPGLGSTRPQTAMAAAVSRPYSPPRRPLTASSPVGCSSCPPPPGQRMRVCATAVDAAAVMSLQQHGQQQQQLLGVGQWAAGMPDREQLPWSVGYPDLTPYLTYPPKRPSSPAAAVRSGHQQQAVAGCEDSTESELVQQLQQLLAEREQQLQMQCQTNRILQEQLQQASDQHVQAREQLQTAEVQATGSCTALQQQLAAAEQALLAANADMQAMQQRLQDQLDCCSRAASQEQNGQLQQQLASAETQVVELQQALHAQQVQHIQAEQEWQQQVAHLEAAAAAAGALQQVHGEAASSCKADPRQELIKQLQSHASLLTSLPAAQALLSQDGEVQGDVLPLCEALQQLAVSLKEAASRLPQQPAPEPGSSLAGSHVSRSSCNTEVLEGQLEATRVEVSHCMDLLTQVVGATRRLSAAGPPGHPDAPVKRFSQLDIEWHPLPAAGEQHMHARRTDESV